MLWNSSWPNSEARAETLQFGHSDWMLWNEMDTDTKDAIVTASIRPQRLDAVEFRVEALGRRHFDRFNSATAIGCCGIGQGLTEVPELKGLQFGHSDWMLWNEDDTPKTPEDDTASIRPQRLDAVE